MSANHRRAFARASWVVLLAVSLPTGAARSRAQGFDAGQTTSDAALNLSDPNETYLRGYTSATQAEALEREGKLAPALAKYRYAASILDQLIQSNPNWQPLIVKYRQHKTIDSIRALEDKGVAIRNGNAVPPQAAPATPPSSYGQPRVLPATPANPTAGSDDDLPTQDEAPNVRSAPRNPSQVNLGPEGVQPVAAAPSNDAMSRAMKTMGDKLAKSEKETKAALEALKTAQQEKKELQKQKDDNEFKLNAMKSQVALTEKRYERTKTNRDELQKDYDQADARLRDAITRNPSVARGREELRKQVDDLKKQLAKAQADADAAAKDRDAVKTKLDASEQNLVQTIKDRDALAKRNELSKDSIQKIEALQNDNNTLTQKLSSAEGVITKLSAESLKKKQDLDGIQRELTTLKDQLASSRDQNDRSATMITELRSQLDDSAKKIDELKAKGTSSDEYVKMSKENEMLRNIVMRQLKDQARQANVKKLLVEELANLDVQSASLDRQIKALGQPSMPLTDEERALFKDPLVTMADATSPDSMAATITTVKPRQPGQTPGEDNAADPTDAQPTGSDAPTARKTGPQVQTSRQPRVSAELLPMANEAMEDYNRNRYPEAERTYDKLLARDPKNPYLLTNQGVVLYRQDKLKSAEMMLKKAVAAAPSDAYAQATLGIVYYKMHRYDEAMNYLTSAIQIDQKNPTAHNYLGITASQKGYSEAAVEQIGIAIALNPNYADAHFNLAVVLATNQPPNKAGAKVHYDTAVRLGASPDPTLAKLIAN